ncbi:hypothetical protein PBK173_000507300 [Plasmodium berghei]|uniref:Uncharacterized protein n=1 Tax=Plasmodium berghei TaxID=5821 RepID=A0A0Y9PRP5_PLABE|nr:hypothetical protein PBK173_000507300 [Plasmodium berghei]
MSQDKITKLIKEINTLKSSINNLKKKKLIIYENLW